MCLQHILLSIIEELLTITVCIIVMTKIVVLGVVEDDRKSAYFDCGYVSSR